MRSSLSLPDQVLGICPLISVSSTARADAACARGGFANLAEFLRPFGQEFRETAVPVQTIGEPYSLRGLRVRVCAAAEMYPVAADVAEQRLIRAVGSIDSDALWRCSPTGISPEESTAPPNTLARIGALAQPSPWFDAFKTELTECSRFDFASTSCTFDLPCLQLLVATTDEPRLLETLRALHAQALAQLQPQTAGGSGGVGAAAAQGPDGQQLVRPPPIYCLLLDDAADPAAAAAASSPAGGAPLDTEPQQQQQQQQQRMAAAAAASALREAQSAFGPERSALLRINSASTLPNRSALVDTRLWSSAAAHAAPGTRPGPGPPGPGPGPSPGSLMSSSDVDAARALVRVLMCDHALPEAQRNVRLLHGTVGQARRGIKNTIKLWAGWGGSTQRSSTQRPSGVDEAEGAASEQQQQQQLQPPPVEGAHARMGLRLGGGIPSCNSCGSLGGLASGLSTSGLSAGLGGFLASSAASMAAAASCAATAAAHAGVPSAAHLASASGAGGGTGSLGLGHSHSGGSLSSSLQPPGSDTTPRFGRESLEWQLQLLADTALVLADYRTAHEAYAMLITELKTQRGAGSHLACALTLRALTSALTDASRRELETALDAAYGQAVRAGLAPSKAFSPTFVTLLQLELSRRLPRVLRAREAANACVRCSTEVGNCHAALLLEEGALCQLHPSLGFERKAAFLLVLAGYRYVQIGLRAHAVRCYAAALSNYAGKRWLHAEDHVRLFLAREMYRLHQAQAAVGCMLGMLQHTEHQGAERQASIVRELVAALRTTAASAAASASAGPGLGLSTPGVSLPIPLVDESSLALLSADFGRAPPALLAHARAASPSELEGSAAFVNSLARSSESWSPMEATLALAARQSARGAAGGGGGGGGMAAAASSNWLSRAMAAADVAAAGGAEAGAGGGAQATAVGSVWVGEPLWVVVALTNPLLVPLEISELSLECTLGLSEPEADGEGGEGGATNAALPATAVSQSTHLEMSAQSVAFAPRERRLLHLRVTPTAQGLLSIRGLSWNLADSRTRARFLFGGSALASAKRSVAWAEATTRGGGGGGGGKVVVDSSRAAAEAAVEAAVKAHGIAVHVRGSQPLLRLRLHGCPSEVRCDELVACSLQLSNTGQRPISVATLCVSVPGCLTLAAAAATLKCETAAGAGAGAGAALRPPDESFAQAVLPLPLDAPIGAGASVFVPLLLRISAAAAAAAAAAASASAAAARQPQQTRAGGGGPALAVSASLPSALQLLLLVDYAAAVPAPTSASAAKSAAAPVAARRLSPLSLSLVLKPALTATLLTARVRTRATRAPGGALVVGSGTAGAVEFLAAVKVSAPAHPQPAAASHAGSIALSSVCCVSTEGWSLVGQLAAPSPGPVSLRPGDETTLLLRMACAAQPTRGTGGDSSSGAATSLVGGLGGGGGGGGVGGGPEMSLATALARSACGSASAAALAAAASAAHGASARSSECACSELQLGGGSGGSGSGGAEAAALSDALAAFWRERASAQLAAPSAPVSSADWLRGTHLLLRWQFQPATAAAAAAAPGAAALAPPPHGLCVLSDLNFQTDLDATTAPVPPPRAPSARAGGPSAAALAASAAARAPSSQPQPGQPQRAPASAALCGISHRVAAPLVARHCFSAPAPASAASASAPALPPCVLHPTVSIANLSLNIALAVYLRTSPPQPLQPLPALPAGAPGTPLPPPPTPEVPPSPGSSVAAVAAVAAVAVRPSPRSAQHGSLAWVGTVRTGPLRLAAGEHVEIGLTAIASAPGTYDLGSYWVAVAVAEPLVGAIGADGGLAAEREPAELVWERGRAHIVQVLDAAV